MCTGNQQAPEVASANAPGAARQSRVPWRRFEAAPAPRPAPLSLDERLRALESGNTYEHIQMPNFGSFFSGGQLQAPALPSVVNASQNLPPEFAQMISNSVLPQASALPNMPLAR